MFFSDNNLTKNPDEGSCPVPEVVCAEICPEPEVVCEEICPEPEVVCEESCPVPEVVCEPKQFESNAVDDQLMASNLTDVVPAFNLAPVVLHPVAVADEQCGDEPVAGQRFCLPDFVPVQDSCVDQILADNVCVKQKQEVSNINNINIIKLIRIRIILIRKRIKELRQKEALSCSTFQA